MFANTFRFCVYSTKKMCYPSLQLKRIHSSKVPQRNTIYALSTPSGTSAVAVVRVSGPKASCVCYQMGGLKNLPEARKATLCHLKDPQTGEILDKALMLWFPSPNSFTGEDICELHIHGGTAVIKSVLKTLEKLQHFCFAEPGEFTKRLDIRMVIQGPYLMGSIQNPNTQIPDAVCLTEAFMAGKLDLTQVEGLADLLHAETEAQQKQALRQMGGALHRLYSDWTGRVKKCLARLEAYIDFSEDQLLEDTILSSVKEELDSLKSEISSHLSDKRKGEKLRSGVFTVLIGQPNVGKSSLLNSLCKRDVAIVSSTAGTTRDIIESSLNLGGYLVNICDTAGVRETLNAIEIEGVKRAKMRSSQADLLIFIVEAKKVLDYLESSNPPPEEIVQSLLRLDLGEEFFKNPREETSDSINAMNACTILLLNKIDLLSPEEYQTVKQLMSQNSSVSAVSCTSGSGMSEFVEMFAERVKEICGGYRGEEPTITQERHRLCVQNCLQNLMEYERALHQDVAIAADKLRCATNELGKITGKISTNDILDVIFKDFCIGK